MTTRDRIHKLVDTLPERELVGIEQLIVNRVSAADPLRAALTNAPDDDEPLTAEEEAAIDEGVDAIARGETVPHAEVRRMVGL